jgi:branched-chain amino acid transport system permease protein
MIYGLIAVGYTMVYGIIGMINFAHGDIFMIGAFVALISIVMLLSGGFMEGPAAIVLVLAISMAFTALYGWSVERIAYRPLRGSFRLAPLISAIGMSIVLQNFVQISQGARVKPLEPQVRGGIELMREGDFVVQLSYMQLLIIVSTLAVLAVFTWLVTRTSLGARCGPASRTGRWRRCSASTPDRTISLTFVIGAALAAVAGTMYLLRYGVIDFYIGFLAGVKAFTGGRARRHRLAPRRGARRPAHRPDRDLLVAYFSVQYKDVAGLLHPGPHPDLPAHRPARPAGGREGMIPPPRCATPAVAALVAFGLFGPLVGLRTERSRPPAGCSSARAGRRGDRLRTGLRRAPRRLALGAAAAIGRALPAAGGDAATGGRTFAPMMLAAAMVLPFVPGIGRYELDLGILVLTYVMLGWGLNIVVGLAGLLDLGYVAFYAVGPIPTRCWRRPSASPSGSACRWPASSRPSGASCSASRCCGCAATTWRS